ncbi:MFS transporter [Pseudoalteromonas ruthenica]|uniref:MFS transporter n=1 Tax=Pseudoalteromonas ruthenica TaxID=151081 RepID=UPI0005F9B525|nr:MFS transporter [Pseudoalteromonas ruthenica]TMO90133.1 MFS transporter [Pseudoalteromonas ruthenica]TMO90788.1 MFS transporter [Pseudoalteromonas ruthenica]TMP01025.1 MFS transporter [Pseudoalteromonas ruthenica]TMP09745.1 MFS transporter [Pseudoalteromonas ruthenica]TMP11614.1 MFS transporter [Pseudoalteromonas ruthenica]
MHHLDSQGRQPIGVILLVLALGTFILGLTEFSMMPMLPLISETFAVTPGQSGYAISAYAIGVVIGAPVFMLVCANMIKRNALAIFVAIMFVANGLSAMAQTLEQLVLFRLLSGLPHGAYFGTALLLAAQLAPAHRRASFMAKVFMGLTIATIVGVPLVTLIGQSLSWRYCLALVALLALIAFVLVLWLVPNQANKEHTHLGDQLEVLKNPLVWSILGIIIIGFGGVFCIYTYIADTILQVTQSAAVTISIAMVMFGIGCTLGNYVLGKAADHSALITTGAALLGATLFALLYVNVATNIYLLCGVIFFIGFSVGLGTVIQSLLMQVSPQGHAMIGALVQCAFNTANAIGPWAGGMALTYGLQMNETGYVSASLFAGGLVMWALSVVLLRRKAAAPVDYQQYATRRL